MRWLALLILFLSACSPPTPQLRQPPAPPASYSLTSLPTAEQLPDRWWRDFGDAALNRLQQQMFSANLDLRQALQRLKQLQARAQSQQSERRPSLNLQGNLSRDSSPAVAGNNRSTRASLSLAAAYEIDLWKRLEQQEEAANLRLQAGKQDVQSLLLSLSAQLTEQYRLSRASWSDQRDEGASRHLDEDIPHRPTLRERPNLVLRESIQLKERIDIHERYDRF